MPQIATEELRIALRLQTLVLPMWLQGFASSASFGAAFEFFAQLCELGNALAVHRSAAGAPDSDISPGIVLLWHLKNRRILGWTFLI